MCNGGGSDLLLLASPQHLSRHDVPVDLCYGSQPSGLQSEITNHFNRKCPTTILIEQSRSVRRRGTGHSGCMQQSKKR